MRGFAFIFRETLLQARLKQIARLAHAFSKEMVFVPLKLHFMLKIRFEKGGRPKLSWWSLQEITKTYL